MRRTAGIVLIGLVLAAALVARPADAAEPASGRVSPDSPSVSWSGDTIAGTSVFARCTAPEYSHAELTYNVLDQESVARGHMAYYLSWADDALRDGGIAFHAAGATTTAELPAQAQLLRRTATAEIQQAERLYASFDFVNATFAARDAWKAAAQYHDLATGRAAGTAELAKGTQQVTGQDATVCAAGGDPAAMPEPAPAGTLPATGGGGMSPVVFPAMLVAAGALLARRRCDGRSVRP